MNTLVPTLNNLIPYSVGFDRMFDLMNKYASHQLNSTGFPPYNIRKEGDNKFFIDLAVAGLSKNELKVEFNNGMLKISSTYDNKEDNNLLFRGISYKKFQRTFTLDENIIVNKAKYTDGILTIELERIVPENKKIVTIPIE